MLRKILCIEYPPIHEILQSPTHPIPDIVNLLKNGDEIQQLDAGIFLLQDQYL
jgi:hypothetical protein